MGVFLTPRLGQWVSGWAAYQSMFGKTQKIEAPRMRVSMVEMAPATTFLIYLGLPMPIWTTH